MQARRHDSAAGFLARAWPWLLGDEVEHSVVLGQAETLARSAGSLPGVPATWLCTVEEAGGVVACGLHQAGQKALVTSGGEAAMAALAADAFAVQADVEVVAGPEPAAGLFAAAWARLSGRPGRAGMRQRLFALERVVPPRRPAAGRLRPAAAGDIPLLSQWTADFLAESGAVTHDSAANLVVKLVGGGQFFLWSDGEPVAMAAWAGRTPGGARVILVYTPPSRRGRGYASGVVAALSAELLAGGCRFVTLHTDLANPTSNHIYQELGFRPVHDAGEHHLAG